MHQTSLTTIRCFTADGQEIFLLAVRSRPYHRFCKFGAGYTLSDPQFSATLVASHLARAAMTTLDPHDPRTDQELIEPALEPLRQHFDRVVVTDELHTIPDVFLPPALRGE